ncbi:hypothetical protein NEOLI_003600 [Neolecta irregularis DAH-3]|uniref:MAGE domain-containing protein n=1 Tax=Neolecta irregularis (strain DAH-3) TaxID=1198029 RepID=A0A1U7LQX6_NEOID|nr:hypothetical protein NEOLI_003600 [Neolecta irregularis DAH-3]|eukprot:OLL24983.1 hypothetical protein NEOLI_003600 [Neolecta irregularis DAH-3]
MPPAKRRRTLNPTQSANYLDVTPRRRQTEGHVSDGSDDSERLPHSKSQSNVGLVLRYSLAKEFTHTPFTRDQANTLLKEVGLQRSFKAVKDEANKIMKDAFGMEIVELDPKERYLSAPQQRKVAANSHSQKTPGGKSGTVKFFIARSILAQRFRDAVIPVDSEAEDLGKIFLIVSLVYLNKTEMPEDILIRYLDKFMPEEGAKLFLKNRMISGKYLDYHKDVNGDLIYHVGPKGKALIDSKQMVGLMHEIYGASAPEDLAKRIMDAMGVEEHIND